MVSGENMKRITLRLPDDLHDAIAEIANEKDRSLNAQIIRALRYYVAMGKHVDTTESRVLELKAGMRDMAIEFGKNTTEKTEEELNDIADVQEADLDLNTGEIEDFDIDELKKKL